MKTTPTQRLVKKAIARTRKTGFRRTHISLELLRTELAGWKGEAEGDGKRSVSSAVATVRRDHKRDTEEIERKREHATADSRMPLGGDTVEQVGKVHVIPISEGGRYVRGMDVRITSDNTPEFMIQTTPKRTYERRALKRYFLAFDLAAAVTFVAGAARHLSNYRNAAYTLLAGAIAVAATKAFNGILRSDLFTLEEFNRRVVKASGAVESALKSIEREIEGSATTDAKK